MKYKYLFFVYKCFGVDDMNGTVLDLVALFPLSITQPLAISGGKNCKINRLPCIYTLTLAFIKLLIMCDITC